MDKLGIFVIALLALANHASASSHEDFVFTSPLYEASVQEKSVGMAAVECDAMMGMWLNERTRGVRFGLPDAEPQFRVEAVEVGNFVFLNLRTKSLSRDRTVRVSALSRDSFNETFCTVSVKVRDINDFQPLFPPKPYAVSIPEDTPVGASIATVKATDSDRDPSNKRFYYRILDFTNNFAVNPVTGVVSLTAPVNHLTQEVHSVRIVASDRKAELSGISRPKETTLTVTVTAVNAHAPSVVVHEQLPPYDSSFATDARLVFGSKVYAILVVSDPDSGKHGEVERPRIVHPNEFAAFLSVQPGREASEYLLVINRAPPATHGLVNVTLRVCDRGQPPKCTTVTVRVSLYDQATLKPQFNASLLEMSINEASPVHSQMGFAEARVQDRRHKPKLLYAIVDGNRDGVFKIDRHTSLITTAKRLNRATASQYNLTVAASNANLISGSLRGTTRVHITIEDANDHDPRFTSKSYTSSVIETAAPGTRVARVHADDLDAGGNGFVVYSIVHPSSKLPFKIDPFNGTIATTSALDYDSMGGDKVYDIRVRARDSGTPYSRKSETHVLVQVRNANDNAPIFTKSDCTVMVPRSTAPGSQLLLLGSVDVDANLLTCSLLSHKKGRFSIDPSTCAVTLRKSLSSTPAGTVYALQVTASDGKFESEPVAVNVTVTDSGAIEERCVDSEAHLEYLESLNRQLSGSKQARSNVNRTSDLPNKFKPSIAGGRAALRAEVPENTAVGAQVCRVRANDRDTGFNGKLWYTIVEGNVDSCFFINPSDGAIHLVRPLDRETRPNYNLTVSVSDMGTPPRATTAVLRLKVGDVNDNAPTFDKGSYSFTIAENAPIGTVIEQKIWASDADAGENARIRYSLVNDIGGSAFSINPVTGYINVTGELDREKKQEYSLKVVATDASKTHPLSSSVRVQIRLLDVNDNAPKFYKSTYRVRVAEDLPTGTVLFWLQAHDPDYGANGELTYSLTDGHADRRDRVARFAVDPHTGMVRLVRKLDYRGQSRYNVTARVRDTQASFSVCYLEIVVLPENRNLHAPYFEPRTISLSVREDADVETAVSSVSAVDRDLEDPERDVGYYITGGTGLGVFRIDQTTGTIYTTRALDRETQRYYWLNIEAKDRAPVPLSGHAFALVEVTDVNDNAPMPQLPVYHASIKENSPQGSVVTQINATDRDGGPDEVLRYTLTTANDLFAINERTGVVTTVRRRLDREKAEAKDLTLGVKIEDSGTPRLSSSVQVVVTLVDENDNSPVFLPQVSRQISLPERNRSRSPEPIARVVAQDLDSGKAALVDYKLKDERPRRFTIHPQTGEISTSYSFSAGDESDVRVKAYDGGTPQRQSRVHRVNIQWRARGRPSPNSPYFVDVSSQPVNYPEHVDVEIPQTDKERSRLVKLFQAADEDPGQELWFSIVGGNEDLMFHINPNEGDLVVVGEPDAETRDFYNLTVEVSDGYNTAQTHVPVIIDDVNDHRPAFDRLTYRAAISEDSSPNSEVLTLEATDGDASLKNRKLVYHILGAENPNSMRKFKITSDGVIVTKATLDREEQREHVLMVEVDDQGVTGPLQGYCRVIISVTDVNEHPPHFTAPSYAAKVTVSAPSEQIGADDTVGVPVVTVHASDRDSGDNARVVYSIASGNNDGLWRVNPSSGEISATRRIEQFEEGAPQRWTLAVQAADSSMKPLTTTTQVVIEAQPDRDGPPQFEEESYAAEVKENAPVGSYIATVLARATSGVTYEITAGNEEGRFTINAHSGVISLATQLDRELSASYDVTVTSSTAEGRSSDVSLVVTVTDVNDNRPVFERFSYAGEISESPQSAYSVIDISSKQPLVVRATDADRGYNSQVAYSIVDASGAASEYFAVDASTGAVRALGGTKLFHYGTPSEFTFEVRATDAGHPSLPADRNAHVTIRVTKSLDHPPEFSTSHYSVEVVVPTCRGVTVTKAISAKSPVPSAPNSISYSISGGNDGSAFAMDPKSGVVTVQNSGPIVSGKVFSLRLRASDGRRSTAAVATVTVRRVPNTLRFTRARYMAKVVENSTQALPLVAVTVMGSRLDDNIRYTILNQNPSFAIGSTSGVVSTTGVPVDREPHDTQELLIEAAVGGKNVPHRSARCVVHVTVIDVNDNAPVFVKLPYYASVQVDAAVGTLVMQANAFDRDSGANGEVSYRLDGSRSSLFAINSRNGNITVRRELVSTFASGNAKFNLTVVATDSGSPALSSRAVLRVSVINRATPVFSSPFYGGLTVQEDAQSHTVVTAQVSASNPDASDVYYSIEEGDPLQQFDVDFATGTITTLGDLDYETTSRYRLRVRARDSQSRAQADVEVEINVADVNDNAPVFAQDSYRVNLLETASIGSEVVKIKATDADSGANGHVTYAILEEPWVDGKNFLIDADTGLIWTALGLDRETSAVMRFVVRASDAGAPQRHTDVTVAIVVDDINDNAPVLGKSQYELVVSNATEPGTSVGKVDAWDPDSSDSGKLKFSLRQPDSQSLLSIDKRTGLLTLASTVKRLSPANVTAEVSVTDGVFESTGQLLLRVVAADTHVSRAEFEESAYEFAVQENSPARKRIGKIKARVEGAVIYQLVTDTWQSDLVRLDRATGTLYTQTSLDREDIMRRQGCSDVLELQAMAVDQRGRIAVCAVRVRVGDVNDNAPLFSQDRYATTVLMHETQIGDHVLKVTAVDADGGASARVAYAWDEDPSNAKIYLNLNMDTGEITLRDRLRRLGSAQALSFFVRASDSDETEPRSNVVSVSIFVATDPDSVPTFDTEDLAVHVPENVDVGTEVTSVHATVGSGGEVAYELAQNYRAADDEEDADAPKFAVDSATGAITVVAPLDRETQPQHDLTVFAYPVDARELVVPLQVTVVVDDVNDSDPEFSTSDYVASVVENQQGGARVLNVSATDADRGANGLVTYSLEDPSGKLGALFKINNQTGSILTLGPLDRERNSSFLIAVKAMDGGNASRSASSRVTVQVVDVNDSPPAFAKPSYQVSIPESAPAGYTTAKFIRAHDDDTPSCTNLNAFISSGDDDHQFEVTWKQARPGPESNYKVGLKVVRGLDREIRSSYHLTVVLTDGLHVATTQVTVNVTDDNDNSPYCEQLTYRVEVAEDATRNTLLAQVGASDPDEGSNSISSYTLVGEGTDMFAIDSETGRLYTAAALDRESVAEYRLGVTSADGGGRSCNTQVHVTVSDVNDNAPAFDESSLRASARENAPLRSLLHRVIAYDADLGANGTIAYELGDDFGGQFYIERASGILVLSAPLDRETVASYSIPVVAIDHGTERRLSATATVHLQVLDVNDNPPVFEHSQYKASVREDADIGRVVAQVSAESLDAGANANLRYTITHGNKHGKFAVDENTGEVSLIAEIDYESDVSYVLTIEASDRSDMPLSSECTLAVAVEDVNDNSPVFGSSSYEVSIAEDAEEGRIIATLKATDRDSGAAGNVTYNLKPPGTPFAVDSASGELSLAPPGVDFERRDSYSISVVATDHGDPVRSSETDVFVLVTDVNDVRPLFAVSPPSSGEKDSLACSPEGANCTVHVQESSSVSVVHGLVRLNATDGDGEKNGAPFYYQIEQGNEKDLFYIDEDNVLKSRKPLRLDDVRAERTIHRVVHRLVVGVRDSGKPVSLSAEPPLNLQVVVLKESQYPPRLTPHRVLINTGDDLFDGGMIVSRLRATDRDPFDQERLQFSLALPEDFEHFVVTPKSGAIKAVRPLSLGSHEIAVRVSDGSRYNVSTLPVSVVKISQEALESSVSITLDSIDSPERYISLYHPLFLGKLAEILPTGFQGDRDLLVISLLQRGASVELLFSIRKPPSARSSSPGFYLSTSLARSLRENRAFIEDRLRTRVTAIESIECPREHCSYKCEQLPVLVQWTKENPPAPVSADSWSLVTPTFQRSQECVCPPGRVGPQCKSICSGGSNPCPQGRECVLEENEVDGYRCASPPDETSVLSFGGQGYAVFKLSGALRKKPFHVNLRLRTYQSNATIFHATSGASGHDFARLETLNGLLRYTYNCGGGAQSMVRDVVHVNDGKWHDVDIQPLHDDPQRPCAFKLTLNRKYGASSQASAGRSRPDLSTVTFGGLLERGRSKRDAEADDSAKRESRSPRGLQHGFRGCLEDAEVNETPLPRLPRPAAARAPITVQSQKNALDTCQEDMISMEVCREGPCDNGGSCLPVADGGFLCRCLPGFYGETCEIVDPCGSLPCMNEGVCLSRGTQIRCECPEGITGDRCEVSDGASCDAARPCKNGGTCIPSTGKCVCSLGWKGHRCGVDVDECATDIGASQCGSAGTCYNYPGGFTCNCTAATAGGDCKFVKGAHTDSDAGPNTAKSPLVPIVVAVAVSLLILIVIVVGVYLYRKRRRDVKYGRRGGSRHSEDIRQVPSYDDYISPRGSASAPPRMPPRPAQYQRSSRGSYPLDPANRDDQEQSVPLCYVRPQLAPVSPSMSASDNDSIKKPPASWQDYDPNKYNDSASSSGRHYPSSEHKTSNYSINDQQSLHWDDTDWKHCGAGAVSPGPGGRRAYSDLPSSPESRRSVSSVATNRSRRSNRSDALPGHYCNSKSKRREKQLLQLVRQEESIPEEDRLCIEQIILSSSRNRDSRNSSVRSVASSHSRPPLRRNEALPPAPVPPLSSISSRLDGNYVEEYPREEEEELVDAVRTSPSAAVTSEEPVSSSSSARPSGSESDSCLRSSSGSERLPPPPSDFELRAMREDDEVLAEELPPALANNSYSSLLNHPYEVSVPTPSATRSRQFHPDQYLINHRQQRGSDASEISPPGSSVSLDLPAGESARRYEARLALERAQLASVSPNAQSQPPPSPQPPVRHESEQLGLSSLSEDDEQGELIRDQAKTRPKRRQGGAGRPPLDPKSRGPRRAKKQHATAKAASLPMVGREAQEMQPLVYGQSFDAVHANGSEHNDTNV